MQKAVFFISFHTENNPKQTSKSSQDSSGRWSGAVGILGFQPSRHKGHWAAPVLKERASSQNQDFVQPESSRQFCRLTRRRLRIHTCLKNLGLMWMLELTVGGSGLMGQAGSRELTLTSSKYSFFVGNTSSHVERSLNRLFRVFSSTYNRGQDLVHRNKTARAQEKHHSSCLTSLALSAGKAAYPSTGHLKHTTTHRSSHTASNRQTGGRWAVLLTLVLKQRAHQRELYLFKDTYKWSD